MHRGMLCSASALVLGLGLGGNTLADGHADKGAVLDMYANIAHAMYEDSLTTAKALKTAVAALDLGSIEFEGSDSLDDPEAVFQ